MNRARIEQLQAAMDTLAEVVMPALAMAHTIQSMSPGWQRRFARCLHELELATEAETS